MSIDEGVKKGAEVTEEKSEQALEKQKQKSE